MKQFREYEKTYRISHSDFYVKGKHNLNKEEERQLLAGQVVITEKMDGANTGIFKKKGQTFLQKRRANVDDSHPQFKRFQKEWYWNNYDKIEKIPNNLVVYGELMYCVHTIYYDKLPDWFLVFDVYDLRTNLYWKWHDVTRLCHDVGLSTVPFIYFGKTDKLMLKQLMPRESAYGKVAEGMVIKNYKRQLRGKIVKPSFVKDPSFEKHWSKRTATFNKLMEE
jgi:ATP-dependent RNA circularization protein (DNA/RNA ligase family)